jgi:glycosyltransferase involved in cell wall biosynthesis
MKKVLIITYYWPPIGGAGVQRWLKFSKYFRQFGWEPVIYTPSNPDFPIHDETLLKDVASDLTVLKTEIIEPYDLYRKIMRKKKTETVNQGFLSEGKENTLMQSAMIWVRGNFFIPDARKFWINPSITYLSKYIQEHKIDAVISTGPPHSMHLIAIGLKHKFNIPWIADFRDPWTQIDFYSQLKLSSFADAKHKKLEHQVLMQANKVVTISPSCGKDLEKLGNRKVDIITNGFDTDDFIPMAIGIDSKMMEGFMFHHTGALNKDRNPYTLWKVLGDLCKENSHLKKDLILKFTGKTDAIVLESLKQQGLESNFIKSEYMPHSEIVKSMMQSPILLLPLNNTPNNAGVLSGKLFEYLAAKRPIFGIGLPNADAAAILKETQAGTMYDFDDYVGMKKQVLILYNQYKTKQLSIQSNSIDKYSRENCASAYAKLLDEIAS